MKRFLRRHTGLVTLMLLASACGSDDKGGSKKPETPKDPTGEITPVDGPAKLKLTLDALFYADGDALSVQLELGDIKPEAESLKVAVAGPDSDDAELVTLARQADGSYQSTTPLPVKASDSVKPNDGTLSLKPGELFSALYFVDKSDPAFADVSEELVSDFAFLEDPEATQPIIEPAVALSDDEDHPDKPSGTLLQKDSLPVQIATHELVLFARDQAELDRFLALSGGSVLGEQPAEFGDAQITSYLVAVDPSQANRTHLDQLRAVFGDTSELYASRGEALDIMTLVHEYQLEGFLVGVNTRLQYQGAPLSSSSEQGKVTHTMKMVAARSVSSGPCVPGDADRTCVENVPAVWAFNELWDKTSERVNVAVLDMGFAPNDDFREPATPPIHQCDMSALPASCGPNAAEGTPTVGNSFFGDRSWHGTGVVQTIGGIVNNDFGAAGVAGQVAVPMLYKYDFRSYAFEMGSGIRRAVDDGASVINISAGYPCNIVTNSGIAFNICSMEGRFGICSIVTAAAHTAAATVCATLGWVPIVGAAACGAATAGAVMATEACFSSLAFGDLRGSMESAVRYAKSQGVPVVASAGNRLPPEAYPEVIRDIVATGEARTERWQVVPATIPDVIAVGAVNANLDNAHFYGERVDIWAPIRSAYVAPSDVADADSLIDTFEIGGTSAAAPYITGVIANMQAVNSNLNPANGDLSDSERGQIVTRIRELLTAEDNSFSNGELVILGYTSQPEERRNLVNPLAAVRAAAAESLPDLTLFEDESLNFSELIDSDDTEATARELEFHIPMSGTILAMPLVDETSPPDVDYYKFTLPETPAGQQSTTITLNYPADYGDLGILGPQVRVQSRSGSPVAQNVYSVVADAGQEVVFSVRGAVGIDNVYRVTVAEPEAALPEVTIVNPPDGTTLCANSNVYLRAWVRYPLFPDLTVSGSDLRWRDTGMDIGTGATLTHSFIAGDRALVARAFESMDAQDSVNLNVVDCIGEPPVATITAPSEDLDLIFDGSDDNGSYAEVTLEGEATDAEDGVLTGASLTWYTDQTDYQEAELGTGTTLNNLRLYGDCFGTTHTIRLIATDSDGNPSAPVVVQIRVSGGLC